MTEPHVPTHPSYDPDRDILLDTSTVKALSHPLRVKLLGLLREHGPSTATALARRLGTSSGVTSYHLRQLADHGLVEEDPERGNGRERWWRSRHRGTYFEPYEGDADTRAAGAEFLRVVSQVYAERIARYVDGMETYVDDLGPEWKHGSNISDALLWLTAEEAVELSDELDRLNARYTRDPDAPTEGRVRVVLQYQLMPQPPGHDPIVEEDRDD